MTLPPSQADSADTSTAKRPSTQTRSSKEKTPQPSARTVSRPSDSHSSSAPATQSKKDNANKDLDPSMPSDPLQSTLGPSAHGQDYKKLGRRSSKPIIDWFQRKLGGTVRARRASESAARARASNATNASGATSTRDKKRPPLPDGFKELTRVKSTPSRGRKSADKEVRRSVQEDNRSSLAPPPISLNGDEHTASDDGHEAIQEGAASTYRSSLARDSLWSPASHLEADEDASVRPLPPSTPPSPSPSRSSSSYLSDPRTFRSMAASTKPTTVLSIDLTPNGMAHIAQAPPTPVTAPQRVPTHIRSGSGAAASSGPASITFSALASSPASSRPSSVQNSPNVTSPSPTTPNHLHATTGTQATHYPQHTTHHPRNNPRPSSPPNDDASLFTLASSAFGIPGARTAMLNGGADSMSVSHQSHFASSRILGEDRSLHFALDNDGDRDTDAGHLGDGDMDLDGGAEREVDASVRALRPRSSRRGSWESEASGWSARVPGGTSGAASSLMGLRPGTPSAWRDRSLWTGTSVRTGGWLSDQMDAGDVSMDPQSKDEGGAAESDGSSSNSEAKSEDGTHEGEPSPISSSGHPPNATTEDKADVPPESTDAPAPLSALAKQEKKDATPTRIEMPAAIAHGDEHEAHSAAGTDGLTDVWHSAPSTPMY